MELIKKLKVNKIFGDQPFSISRTVGATTVVDDEWPRVQPSLWLTRPGLCSSELILISFSIRHSVQNKSHVSTWSTATLSMRVFSGN